MGSEQRREPRVEARLVVRLALGSVDEFVERYALDVSAGGIFVRTRDPVAAGTEVSLDLQLATGERVVHGKGVVAWTCPPSAPGEPPRDPGMGIRFTELDPESRALIDRIVATRPGAGKGSEPPRPPEAKLERAHDEPAGASPGAAPPAPVQAPLEKSSASGPRRSRVVGIDLGTTNSCVAVAENGRARLLTSRLGLRTIPSVVAFDAHGRLLVGHPAKAQMVVNPANTVYGSKRLMGRPFHGPAIQACMDRFHYGIVEGPSGETAVRFAGREFSLQQVAAFALGEIRRFASEALDEEVDRAVITVPAYYSDRQRQAVREAGLLAGLQVERIVNEPTAAALAYGHGRGLDERVLVYDLGGGTFDASVVEIRGEVYEVLSTGGDTFLGGMDFDDQLLDHLVWRFMEENGQAPANRVAWQRIRDAAEETKVALSTRDRAVALVPFLCADPEGRDLSLEVEVTRAELEALTGRLVERTMEVCREVLAARRLAPADVAEVLLVGGQSRMPLVRHRIREVLGREPSKAVHPDEAVALGAALLADSAAHLDSVVLIDVLPMAIGVGLPGGRMAPVLPRNARLPARKTYELATVRDGQVELELAVFQGDAPRAAECEYLGTVHVAGLPPGPRGAVKVAVEFALGSEGILSVTARELGTGRVTEARLATRDTPASLRRKLGMPEPGSAAPVGPAEPPRGGMLDRLFGRSSR